MAHPFFLNGQHYQADVDLDESQWTARSLTANGQSSQVKGMLQASTRSSPRTPGVPTKSNGTPQALPSPRASNQPKQDPPLSSRSSLDSGRHAPGRMPGDMAPAEMTANSGASGAELSAHSAQSASAKLGSILDADPDSDIPPGERSICTWARRIVEHPRFEMFFVTSIILNVFSIAIVAQREGMRVQVTHLASKRLESDALEQSEFAFDIIGWIFEVLFTSEIVMKMIVFRLPFFFDWWNIFDFLVVSTSLGSQVVGSLGLDLKILRTLRLLKLMRLMKLARSIQQMDGLYVMVTALRGSMLVLLWAIVLLMAIQVTIALILNQSLVMGYFKNEQFPLIQRQECYEYFGTFTRALLSSFEMTLANWPPIARMLTENVSHWFILFCIFHKLTFGFAVVGVINGVFMQETFKVAALDDVIMVRQKEKGFGIFAAKMRNLFKKADTSGDGKVDKDEFREILHHQDVKSWLLSMDLSVRDADVLFSLIDSSGDGNGEVGQEDLIQGVGRLKGPARSIDVNKMLMDMRCVINQLQDTMNAASV